MKNVEMNYDTKYPYLLPKNSYFTKLVVINSHKDVKHNGVKQTQSNLRLEFWITQSRNFVKKITHECLCKYMEGKKYDYPEAPPLTEFRMRKDPSACLLIHSSSLQ